MIECRQSEDRQVLTIRLVRLPDINSSDAMESAGFLKYGRFAIIRGGRFWFCPNAQSSHPGNCDTGWYWAINKEKVLLVSARGAGIDGEALFRSRKNVLAMLIEDLVKHRIIRKPGSVKIVQD